MLCHAVSRLPQKCLFEWCGFASWKSITRCVVLVRRNVGNFECRTGARSDVDATGMLSVYPGVCVKDKPYPHAHFCGYKRHALMGVALARSSAWVLWSRRRTGRCGYPRFCAKTAISCANPPTSCDTPPKAYNNVFFRLSLHCLRQHFMTKNIDEQF